MMECLLHFYFCITKIYRATTHKNLMMTTNNFRKSFRNTCTYTRDYRPINGLPLFIANSLAPSQSYLKSSLSPVAFRVNQTESNARINCRNYSFLEMFVVCITLILITE